MSRFSFRRIFILRLFTIFNRATAAGHGNRVSRENDAPVRFDKIAASSDNVDNNNNHVVRPTSLTRNAFRYIRCRFKLMNNSNRFVEKFKPKTVSRRKSN